MSITLLPCTWLVRRFVPGAITRTTHTTARPTDTTVPAGSSAAFSSAPDPGITAGMVIPGAGDGVTPVGMGIAAGDTVADTDIAVADTEARGLSHMAAAPDLVRAIAGRLVITDTAAVQATTDFTAQPDTTGSAAAPATVAPTTLAAWAVIAEAASVADTTAAALVAVDSTVVAEEASMAVVEVAVSTAVVEVDSTAVADTGKADRHPKWARSSERALWLFDNRKLAEYFH